MGAVYPTAETAPALLAKGHGDARSVGLASAVASPELAPDLLSQASADLRALAAAIDDEKALPEELRGVDAPKLEPDEAEPSTDEEGKDDEAAADAETEADDADDDDDDAGGEGLGAMFG